MFSVAVELIAAISSWPHSSKPAFEQAVSQGWFAAAEIQFSGGPSVRDGMKQRSSKT